MRTFTGYALRQGFRVAVLNHLGAKKEGGLSTPRIFTYGKEWTPGGVLRYISDGDVRSPFLGLKFAI